LAGRLRVGIFPVPLERVTVTIEWGSIALARNACQALCHADAGIMDFFVPKIMDCK